MKTIEIKKKHFSCAIDKSLFDEIRILAKKDKRSFNYMVNEGLIELVKKVNLKTEGKQK